jgi:hypothetical protein
MLTAEAMKNKQLTTDKTIRACDHISPVYCTAKENYADLL